VTDFNQGYTPCDAPEAIPFIEIDKATQTLSVSSESMNFLGSLPKTKKIAPVVICGTKSDDMKT